MKRILIIAGLIITAYAWMIHSLSFMTVNTRNQVEQEAFSKAEEKNAKELLTTDELGQQVISNTDDMPSGPSEADDVVPQQLLEMEAEAKAGSTLYNAGMDDVDIPPLDPNKPNDEFSPALLPPTEPEREVVPQDLKVLESQPQQEPSNINRDVPMVGDPEEYLQPDELPPEAAEIEVLPYSLQIEEKRQGH